MDAVRQHATNRPSKHCPPTHLWVELKVDNLASRQRDRHLALVGGGAGDGFAAGGAPLVDAAVGADVAQPAGVHLQRRIITSCFEDVVGLRC